MEGSSNLAMAFVMVLVAGLSSLWLIGPLIARISRRPEVRCGTIEILQDPPNANFEIVAVHGLGANPEHTWTHAADDGEPKAAKLGPTYFPGRVHLLRDLLAHEFPRARILNFAHNSNWLTDAPIKTTEEIGKSLLEEITAKRSRPRLPIIFLGHSLGGIIIKQALCGQNPQKRVDEISGIIFLGTPHHGSSASIAGVALAYLTSFLGSSTVLLSSLKSHDNQLSSLVERFQLYKVPDPSRPQKFRVISFYETKPTILFRWLSLGQVVSRDSAVVHGENEAYGIDTDHSGLNKCGGLDDRLFVKLKQAVDSLRTPSLLETADEVILKEYYNAEKLMIKRLSGALLSMNQCYINLAVVEFSEDKTRIGEEAEHSQFSLFSRQNVNTPEKEIQVDLAEIFNPRSGQKGRDGDQIQPRRIFIRGRAGVGKTTLCKKIVYEFGRGTWSQWTKMFDRVLWVPLRNLKLDGRRNLPKYNFEDLFLHEYFSQQPNGPKLSKELSDVLATEGNKTLFLLDGLDEVSHDLRGDGAMPEFLKLLLNQTHVIITSRPNAGIQSLRDIDLEFETIGFYPGQVKEYIENSFTDPEIIEKVQSFLQGHWLLQGLVRIPIQLDAFCYTWESLNPGATLNTMTDMYKAIEASLWRKDLVQLGSVPQSFVDSAQDFEVDSQAKGVITLLEYLAFNGLHSNIVDFTSAYRNELAKRFAREVTSLQNLPLDEKLIRLSFLRTSDPLLKTKDRNYHFIHLTFQEYFAARYFVRQWQDPQGKLQFLALGSKDTDTKPCSPVEFLRKHKYTARYDIFWRFVAGLLNGNSSVEIDARESEQITRFFTTIEEEPFDLIGPTHQRLVMHCLSEVPNDLSMRKALEQRLSQWLIFECKFNRSVHLAGEVEFPELALKHALGEQSPDVQNVILLSLARGASVPRNTISVIAPFLEAKDEDVRSAAVQALGRQSALPGEVLTAVAARLEDNDKYVRRAAIEALGGQSALPNEIITAVVARLEHNDEDVRWAAVIALGGQSALPGEILTVVAARLEHHNKDVRWTAVQALGRQSALPGDVLMAVAARLEHNNKDVRSVAVQALGGQSALPSEILTAVAARLEDNDKGVRSAAIEALGGQSALPGEILTTVAARLEDNDEHIRWAAIKALGGQSALPNDILTAVAARLEHNNKDVQRAAVEALGRQSALPSEILTTVAAWLEDNDEQARWAAVEALGGQSALPGEVLTAVAARLDDNDEHVRMAAIEALGGQSALPSEILTAVAARLEDNDKNVRRAAVEAVGRQSALPSEILTTVAARLEHNDGYVRMAAIEALGVQSTLPGEVLTAIAARLEDNDKDVRRAAIEAVGRQSAPPGEILKAVAARLEDNDEDVRRAAIEALGGQSALPNEILTAVVARLEHNDMGVRRAAIEALGGQSALPGEILKAVAARLEHNDQHVRSAAVQVLGRQSALPSEILTAVAARLEHDYQHVRWAAVQALGGQSALPSEILTAVAARLEHNDENIRWAAVKALGGQSALPGEILTAVAARLEDNDERVRVTAEAVIERHQESYHILLDGSYVALLYKNILQHSFTNQVSWYFDENFCANMPEGIRRISIDDQQLRAKIKAARTTFDGDMTSLYNLS